MADSEGKPVEEVNEEAEIEDVEDEAEIEEISSKVPASIMQNPSILAKIQSKIESMQGMPSGYIQSLPKSVKRRIKALKKLQFEGAKIEADFYKEVHDLECKYAAMYNPLYDKRKDVVTASVEPTDEECDWPSDDEKEDQEKDVAKLSEEIKNKAKIENNDEKDKDNEGADVKGIPHFWLTVFKNVDMLSEMIQDHDEPIFSHLQDIKVKFSEAESMGFTLEFYFEQNEYFTNTVLTKHYIMKSEPDETDPFSFEGPEIIKCEGCKIDWNKGKNVTVKTVKKKQKHKGRGTTRTVTKTVQNDSFFNFFSPPTVPDDVDEEDMDDDLESLLAADFEIGHFIRERIVPRAVLYFTGEALENDDDDYDDEDGEEEGEEGEYDEDQDPDYQPQVRKPLHARILPKPDRQMFKPAPNQSETNTTVSEETLEEVEPTQMKVFVTTKSAQTNVEEFNSPPASVNGTASRCQSSCTLKSAASERRSIVEESVVENQQSSLVSVREISSPQQGSGVNSDLMLNEANQDESCGETNHNEDTSDEKQINSSIASLDEESRKVSASNQNLSSSKTSIPDSYSRPKRAVSPVQPFCWCGTISKH